MASPSNEPVAAGGVGPAGRDIALSEAERFLAGTSEAIGPDTPAPALLRYLARYRAHLATVVAIFRERDARQTDG